MYEIIKSIHGECYKLSVCAIAVSTLLLLRTNKQTLCKTVCTCHLAVCVRIVYVFEPHMLVLVHVARSVWYVSVFVSFAVICSFACSYYYGCFVVAAHAATASVHMYTYTAKSHADYLCIHTFAYVLLFV